MLGTAASSITSRGGHARADRDREVRRGDLLQIQLDHHVLGDLPAIGGTILQAVKPSLHVGNPAFEPSYKGFVSEGRADDGDDDLMQVGEPLHGIGEGPPVDLGVFRPEAVADGTVGDSGKVETLWETPTGRLSTFYIDRNAGVNRKC